MIIQTKDETVNIAGLQPVMREALPVIGKVFQDAIGYAVITSALDGKHSAIHSRHYIGLAVDLRTWVSSNNPDQLSITAKEVLATKLREALGKAFYVRVEGNHIHISWKPTSVKIAQESLIGRS